MKNSTCRGFTLMEAIISISLSLMIATIIMFIVPSGIKRIREIKSVERLHSDAEFLIGRLTFFIKQAKNLETVSSSILEIEMPDASVKTVSAEGERITIDGIPFSSNEIKVMGLSFEKISRSVKVNFTLEAENTGETILVKTTITQRNNY